MVFRSSIESPAEFRALEIENLSSHIDKQHNWRDLERADWATGGAELCRALDSFVGTENHD